MYLRPPFRPSTLNPLPLGPRSPGAPSRAPGTLRSGLLLLLALSAAGCGNSEDAALTEGTAGPDALGAQDAGTNLNPSLPPGMGSAGSSGTTTSSNTAPLITSTQTTPPALSTTSSTTAPTMSPSTTVMPPASSTADHTPPPALPTGSSGSADDTAPDPTTDATDEGTDETSDGTESDATEGPTDSDPDSTDEPTDPDPTMDPPDPPAPESQFNIELRFENQDELDPIVEEAFEAARQRWEQVIVGDVMDVDVPFAYSCDGFEVPSFIDDLIIFVTTDPIDGREGILGSAGPCLIRGDGIPLPMAGRMIFDSADLMSFAEAGRLEEIVLHEMGHVLGVGSLWEGLELLADPAFDNSGSSDTAFEGERAIAQFDAAGGNAYEGSKVPVENTGGDGVANGHWRESVLGNELMTPFMSNLEGQLSAITIASLEDIGYAVSYDEADDYSWPPPREGGGFGPAAASGSEWVIDLSDDVLRLPLQRVMNAR